MQKMEWKEDLSFYFEYLVKGDLRDVTACNGNIVIEDL